MTLVGPGTWEAARAAVDCALTAVDLVLRGRASAAYALCRPPGHHATPRGYGGSCYLNNAAVAAEALRAAGHDAGRGRRRRRPPRQRHPGDLLGRGRRALRVGARGPGGGLVPARLRVRATRPAPARGRVRRATCRSRRAPATGPGWTAVADLAGWVADAGLHGAGGLARRRRRRRRPGEPAAGHRRRLPRRRAGCSAGSACRACSCRRAATTSPRLGGAGRGVPRRSRHLTPGQAGVSAAAAAPRPVSELLASPGSREPQFHHGMQANLHIPRHARHGKCRVACIPW